MAKVNAATTQAGQRRTAYAEMAATKADQAQQTISADLEILNGTPTNAQVIAILKRSLVREQVEIRVLLHVIQDITHTGG